jgi:transposase-like protein
LLFAARPKCLIITSLKGVCALKKIESLVRWFCGKLSLRELFTAAVIILEVLNEDRSDIKTKDAFRIEHPHYRKFDVDPKPPFTECPPLTQRQPTSDWQQLIEQYRFRNGKKLKPVKHRNPTTTVSKSVRCPNCNAPANYIHYNDGKKRTQLHCKVCDELFQQRPHRRKSNAKYWCPHCNSALYLWKKSETYTSYKCPNDKCPRYLSAKSKLNSREQKLQKQKSSQFKLRYQYREYHFDPGELVPAAPQKTEMRIDRIHNSLDTLGLVLTFNISYGLSSRRTAQILTEVFGVSISYQTVINYANAAALHCHKFNMHHKGSIDPTVAGDETYIRVQDQWNYTWFTIGANSRAIHAYHLSDNRGAKHALITLKETMRTVDPHLQVTLVSDGNPSYDTAIHAINADKDGKPMQKRTVIGLQNDDDESTEFRPFKQIVERLIRTYKFHTRARSGFKDFNGAVALTVLFVTYYNFLRPHYSLNHKCPVPLNDLNGIQTIQGRWGKILQMAIRFRT